MTTDLTSTTRPTMDRLFDPRSIAVVGASTDPGKRGYQVIRALQESGYGYPIYAVNPRGGEVLGVPLRPSIADLPNGIDLALIALPSTAVPDAIRAVAKVGVAGAVVLANGFRESDAEGAALEAELAAAITETGIRVIGPNTSGMLNVTTGANLVGVRDVPSGPVSVVTQSGNMLLSLLADNRATRGPGFHSYVGLGNQIDVGYAECVTHLAAMPHTGAIAVHTEGLPDGRAFLVAAAAATQHCPIVLLRGGRSEVGRQTALSHTGSVAGSDAVATAVLTQAGIELVERSDELAIVTGVLATAAPVPDGRAAAVLSDGGGHATLAADALVAAGVPLATVAESTRDKLRILLGRAANVANPVDVAGATDADPALFADAAAILMADPAVGVVLVVGLYGGYHLRFDPRLHEIEDRTAVRLVELAARRQLPMVVQSCYAADDPHNHQVLRDGGIPVLSSIDHAVRSVAALYRRGRRLASLEWRSDLRLPDHIAAATPSTAGRHLDEPAARTLLEAAGLKIGPWQLAKSPADAEEVVARLGGGCAMKVVAPQVTHKSDVGGVRLNVTAATAAAAYVSIVESVGTHLPGADITGVVVTPMAEPGVELLVGATIDPIFGPIVAFGAGGVLVEALREVTFRAAPLTMWEAAEMIDETAAARMLDGYRGLPRVDRKALAAFLVQIGEFVTTTPGIAELDLNPVIANADGIVPVDVRVVLTDKERA